MGVRKKKHFCERLGMYIVYIGQHLFNNDVGLRVFPKGDFFLARVGVILSRHAKVRVS